MTDKPKPIIIARHHLVRLNSIRDWVWDDPMHVFLSDLIHTALHYMDEAERLRAALEKLRDCDWVITLPDRMDAVRDIARQALGGK